MRLVTSFNDRFGDMRCIAATCKSREWRFSALALAAPAQVRFVPQLDLWSSFLDCNFYERLLFTPRCNIKVLAVAA